MGYSSDTNFPDLEELLDLYSSIDPTLNWEAESEAFLVHSFTAGPMFRHTSGQLYVGATLGAGIALVRFPEIMVEASDGSGNSAEVTQERAWSGSFAARANAKVGFWIDSSTAITLGVSYLYTNPEAEDVEQKISENGTVIDSDSYDIEQEIQILTIPIGVVISL